MRTYKELESILRTLRFAETSEHLPELIKRLIVRHYRICTSGSIHLQKSPLFISAKSTLK
ncbi:hypothetical protein SAMN05216231_3651 [Virgibacillus salinus]|uniref:Uncharacterized protein n=1 Tax=Virgibacillus salinus TaxID=553311 RepID=A0A1H1GD47_9BACI|nr:hypothetical protein SAMN05216231_3651 [Virgibacillus salinus]